MPRAFRFLGIHAGSPVRAAKSSLTLRRAKSLLVAASRSSASTLSICITVAQSESTGVKWYHGVTRYQWLILAIASAGWVFDVYEGQIFNITRNQLLADIL